MAQLYGSYVEHIHKQLIASKRVKISKEEIQLREANMCCEVQTLLRSIFLLPHFVSSCYNFLWKKNVFRCERADNASKNFVALLEVKNL